VLLGGYAVLVALTNIGSITAPTLVRHQPGLLLGLSSRIRHLLFAVPAGINPVAYAVVPVVRITAAGLLCFALGYWYGERGMGWLERQLGDDKPASLRWIERGVDRAGWLMLFLMPGSNVVCALTGYRRMDPRKFLTSLVAGIAFRLAWVWIAAKQFESELKRALDWIEKYQWPLVVGFLVITVGQSFVKAARKASAEAADEQEEAAAELAAQLDAASLDPAALDPHRPPPDH